MSVQKLRQLDGSANWLLYIFSLLGRVHCMSTVSAWANSPLRCTMTRYHSGRHYDANAETSWAYGDEFFR